MGEWIGPPFPTTFRRPPGTLRGSHVSSTSTRHESDTYTTSFLGSAETEEESTFGSSLVLQRFFSFFGNLG